MCPIGTLEYAPPGIRQAMAHGCMSVLYHLALCPRKSVGKAHKIDNFIFLSDRIQKG